MSACAGTAIEHPREGGDGDDDAQGHAGDDLPQVVCLLVRGPCGPADGWSEATSAPESGSTSARVAAGYAPVSWKSTRLPLQGTLVRLRAHEPADIAALNDLINDPEVGEGLGMVMPQAVVGLPGVHRHDREGSVRSRASSSSGSRLGSPIGGCSFFSVETPARTALLGIWLGKPYWDGGLGTDAVRTLCRFGFDHMNLQRIELDVFEPNPRAKRAYEKVGFVLEGTRRRSEFVGRTPRRFAT